MMMIPTVKIMFLNVAVFFFFLSLKVAYWMSDVESDTENTSSGLLCDIIAMLFLFHDTFFLSAYFAAQCLFIWILK